MDRRVRIPVRLQNSPARLETGERDPDNAGPRPQEIRPAGAGSVAQGAMRVAGGLAMAALSLTAAVCIRTAIITGRPIQQIMRAMPG